MARPVSQVPVQMASVRNTLQLVLAGVFEHKAWARRDAWWFQSLVATITSDALMTAVTLLP